MYTGHFYFIKNQYFIDFPDPFLMQNRGPSHDRPCFYAFMDHATGLYWMIPFSSRVEKFRQIYENKVNRHGRCDTIDFGYVLGHEKAFLIQNMFPITPEYMNEEYIDSRSNVPVRINGAFEVQLVRKAQRVLALQRRGMNFIYPDVLAIEQRLLNRA